MDTSEAVAAYLRERQQGAQASMGLAIGSNPDQEAEYRKLAAQAGLPVDSVRAAPNEVKQQVQLRSMDFADMQQRFPSTASYLGNLDNAKIAHDDVENLGLIETMVNSLKRGWPGLKQGLAATSFRANAGILADVDRVEERLRTGQRVLDIEDPYGISYMTPDQREEFKRSVIRATMGNATKIAATQSEKLAIPQPAVVNRVMQAEGFKQAIKEFATDPVRFVASVGPESLVTNAPGIVAAVPASAFGGPAAGASVMGAGSFTIDYANTIVEAMAREGVDILNPQAVADAAKDQQLMKRVTAQAFAHAMFVGGFDALSGGLGSKMLIPKTVVAKPVVREVANVAAQVPVQGALGAAGEAAGEVAAGQKLDAGNILAEFVGEGFGAPAEIGSIAAGQIRQRLAQARQAQQHGAAAEGLAKIAEASKVRARDAESFKAFVAQAAENGTTEMYIDPAVLVNSLNQSGMTIDELSAVAPTTAKQLRVALENRTDVRVPVEEFAAAGEKITAPLIDHLRTSPDGMTRAEAAEFLKEQGEQLRNEVQKALERHEENSAFQQSAEAVRRHFETELNNAKRFTPDVNQAYAELLANFYAAQARRAGMTPEAMLGKYGLRVQSQETQGARVLNQAPIDTREFKSWFGDSKVVDAEGKPLVVYHGTKGNFSEFSGARGGSNWDDEASKIGFFFTQSPGEAEYFAHSAAGVGGESVIPAHLALRNPARITPDTVSRFASEWLGRLRDSDPDEYEMQTATHQYAEGRIHKGLELAIVDAKERGRDGAVIELEDGTNWYVAFSPELIKSAIGNRGTFDPSDPNILNQENRASIGFADDITKSPSVIALLKGADLSSFLHESGHFFLEVQADLAARIQAQANAGASISEGERRVVDDMGKILDWFGIKGGLEEWGRMSLDQKREHHEQFARGFEAYAFEGKAPSIALQSVFQRFRSWLVRVYKSLKSLNVQLSEDVRGVMDRMIATDEAIAEAEAQRNMGALFKDAESAGMTMEEYQKYQATAQAATEAATQELQTRSLKDMQWLSRAKEKALKARQAEVDGLRREIRHEVSAEVLSQPVYRAWQFLSGRADEVDTVVPGAQPYGEIDTIKQKGKLRTSLVKELSPENWEVLSKRRMTSENSGLHPDLVAELFGYDSGDAMVQALIEAQPPRDLIADMTDQRMLERYGDIGSEEALSRAADEAVHNEARSRFIATELRALEKAGKVRDKSGKRSADVVANAAKQYAADIIARLRVRDIRPGQYAASQARNGKLAEQAFKKGNLEEAAMHKRNQLVNNYATKAAYDAQAEVKSATAYFKKFDKRSKSIDPDYQDQIEALLERFDLSNASLRQIDNRKSLAEWVEAQREQGLEPDIPQELLNEANRQSYKDMTVEEIRGLRDTVKQIEHLGRLKKKLLTAKEKRDFDEVRTELVSGIEANANGRKADTRTPNTLLGEKLLAVKNFGASHIKAATWARIMDGGKDGGPVWEYLIRSANEAGDKETVAREKATKHLSALLAPVLKQGSLGGNGKFFPSVNRSLNRQAKLAIALNTGNESNLQRLLGGEGWTLEQIQPVLDTLTQEEWTFVQGVWDYFESFRPEIAAKERRVYGKEPDWIEATPVVTKFGTLRGGYYPVKYDPRASQRADSFADAEDAKQQMQGAFTSATTRRSFTKSRVAQVVGRPLLYSLDGMYSGVQDVIHDLSWHEWLIDTNKLLRSDALDGAIREHYGPDVVKQIKNWVNDVAVGDRGVQAAGEKALAWVRQGVSISGLGLNVMSALVQPLGITQSIVRVGPTWIAKGIGRAIGSPVSTYREITGKSEFMRTRALTRMRELAELRNQVKGQTQARAALDSAAYALMLRAQQLVDIPTWWGAYEKAIAGGNDEARSAALADQAVIDSQGSGSLKDLSAIERGGPALKLFTTFYSFMNTALNVGVQTTMTESKAKTAASYLLLYVAPPLLGFLLKEALTPGDSGDTEDWEKFTKRAIKEQTGFLLGLFFGLRELQGLWDATQGKPGGDYSGPAGTRLISDTLKLAKQAGQGENDDALHKAVINLAGELLRLPSAQINRTVAGAKALAEDKTDNPAALLFGYQEPH